MDLDHTFPNGLTNPDGTVAKLPKCFLQKDPSVRSSTLASPGLSLVERIRSASLAEACYKQAIDVADMDVDTASSSGVQGATRCLKGESRKHQALPRICSTVAGVHHQFPSDKTHALAHKAHVRDGQAILVRSARA